MPNKALVTGVAGFIGSHLAERLVDLGFEVTGIDCFTDFYPRIVKEANLVDLLRVPNFSFIEGDILDLNWETLLEGTGYLFHQAGQASVLSSWGDNFGVYVRNNILATQRILESAKAIGTLTGMIFASSSSVYGEAERFPTSETVMPRPVSPYGVTKVACEDLCRIYHQNFGVPVVILRYFSVYGPRQRPDIAFHRFIEALLQDGEITIYGDGEQTRDFTYVSDVVQANILAMNPSASGQVFNVGGGSRVKINQVIEILEHITNKRARVSYVSRKKGEARNTSADISKTREWLDYMPQVSIERGLRNQVEWMIQRHSIAIPTLGSGVSQGKSR